jgi:hypothetical protein
MTGQSICDVAFLTTGFVAISIARILSSIDHHLQGRSTEIW